MAKLNNLTSNKVQERKRQVRTYGTKTDLSSSTIDRGNTHWTTGSRVSIDGLLDVDGTMNVTGTLNGSGDINLSGSTEITGPLDITGATTIGGSLDVTGPTSIDGKLDIGGDTTITGSLDVDGPTAITGTLGIEGVTTLKNDLNVTTGGKIKVGSNMTLTPLADGGSISFQDGSKVTSVGGTVRMVGAGSGAEVRASLNAAQFQVGSSVMGIDSAGDYWMQNGGGSTIMSSGNTTQLTGNLDVSGAQEVGGQLKVNSTPIKAASQLTPLGIDTNGVICRIG